MGYLQLVDLDSADDLALLSHAHGQVQRKTIALYKVSKSIDFSFHSAKSKILKVETKSSRVVLFCYLRSLFDKNGEQKQTSSYELGKHKQHLPHWVISGGLKNHRL